MYIFFDANDRGVTVPRLRCRMTSCCSTTRTERERRVCRKASSESNERTDEGQTTDCHSFWTDEHETVFVCSAGKGAMHSFVGVKTVLVCGVDDGSITGMVHRVVRQTL